uniref:hypothetical protein n=1 Tax=Algoriphagus sp. TaxID=1872435 RepID=UPI0040487185
MEYKSKKDNGKTLQYIGAGMIALAWFLGWMGPEVGISLFVGGILVMALSIFVN